MPAVLDVPAHCDPVYKCRKQKKHNNSTHFYFSLFWNWSICSQKWEHKMGRLTRRLNLILVCARVHCSLHNLHVCLFLPQSGSTFSVYLWSRLLGAFFVRRVRLCASTSCVCSVICVYANCKYNNIVLGSKTRTTNHVCIYNQRYTRWPIFANNTLVTTKFACSQQNERLRYSMSQRWKKNLIESWIIKSTALFARVFLSGVLSFQNSYVNWNPFAFGSFCS